MQRFKMQNSIPFSQKILCILHDMNQPVNAVRWIISTSYEITRNTQIQAVGKTNSFGCESMRYALAASVLWSVRCIRPTHFRLQLQTVRTMVRLHAGLHRKPARFKSDYTDREFSSFSGASSRAFNKYTLKYATASTFHSYCNSKTTYSWLYIPFGSA
jgi:hypothetical protein